MARDNRISRHGSTNRNAGNFDSKGHIRSIPDFPKPGVLFRDITTLLKRADGFHAVIQQLSAAYGDAPIDKVAAIESRGFIVGAALAYELHVGFVPIRKQGSCLRRTSVRTTSSSTGPIDSGAPRRDS